MLKIKNKKKITERSKTTDRYILHRKMKEKKKQKTEKTGEQ